MMVLHDALTESTPFRDNPVMLTEFSSTQPRRAVKPRCDTDMAEGGGDLKTPPES
ncbi:MAG TPA: hypothetical protein VH877_09795 [Polyangia bacterium]|jgi:hypothetical protein|nr:hypothetical protein [Polyangia bacterium]